MEKELLILLDRYGKELSKDTAKQYISILRDYFIPYIIENYQCNNLKSLFCDEITKNGIIQSAIYFVKHNENIKYKARLSFFLNALSTLFTKIIFEEYPNPNIRKIHPFTNLMDEICNSLSCDGIELYDSEQYPCITDEQFQYIIQYLKRKSNQSLKSMQEHIIIKLYLLYGISPDKIANLPLDSYSSEKNTLQVPCSNRKSIVINLELPYELSIEINKFIAKRKDISSTFLFTTLTGKQINYSYLNNFFDNLKNDFNNSHPEELNISRKNPFTPTGLQKYAIVKMIESGMNQSIIMDFTDQKEYIFNDCQNIVDEKKGLNRNRYINHMIRGIDTYDLL